MNTFGIVFRVSLFGESHGPSVGVTIDGCPPGIPLKTEDFTADLGGGKGPHPELKVIFPRFFPA
jgi:chorismate synthase